MKWSTGVFIGCGIVLLFNFDALVVFFLSGLIPGTNLVIPPATMIAAMIGSALIIPFRHYRTHLYRLGLSLYDYAVAVASTHEADLAPSTAQPTHSLPKRRYREL